MSSAQGCQDNLFSFADAWLAGLPFSFCHAVGGGLSFVIQLWTSLRRSAKRPAPGYLLAPTFSRNWILIGWTRLVIIIQLLLVCCDMQRNV